MQVSNLPTESEIYNKKNIKFEETYITMNIYDPPTMNNNLDQIQSNVDINQTHETLVFTNINKFSFDKVEDNTQNYPLSEIRNKSTAPLTIEKKVIIYNSVNPNINDLKQRNIIENPYNQQKMEKNVLTSPKNNKINQGLKEEKKEEYESDDICCCIIKIILILSLLPIFILCFCIILFCCGKEEEDRDSECIPWCFYGICFKRRRKRARI